MWSAAPLQGIFKSKSKRITVIFCFFSVLFSMVVYPVVYPDTIVSIVYLGRTYAGFYNVLHNTFMRVGTVGTAHCRWSS
jgi:hypothetical protein